MALNNVIGIINGNIYTSFKPLRRSEALLSVHGRIVQTGKNRDIEKLTKDLGGIVVDVEGKTIFPGFIDAHLHLDEIGLSLNSVNLKGCKDIEELKERLRKGEKIGNKFVFAFGWDQEELGCWPSRSDLDEVFPDVPVMAARKCMHAAVLNSVAIETTGIGRKFGESLFNSKLGLVFEEAFEFARSRLLETLTENDYAELIDVAQKHVIKEGITAVGFVSVSKKPLKGLFRLYRTGKLVLRVATYLTPKAFEGTKETLEGPFRNDRLRINGLKIIADGSLGARTARLREPYTDESNTKGVLLVKKKKLRRVVLDANERGFQVAVHAIGDATLDVVIEAYNGTENNRVEHASIVRPDQIEQLKEINPYLVVQPSFVLSDWWAENRLGERKKYLYPFKTLLNAGLRLAFSTDAPIEPLNPWRTLRAAIVREEEGISHLQALHLYTKSAAESLLWNRLGSLERGNFADFIVLSEDPFNVQPEELERISVEETWIGGKRVFKA